MRQALTMEVAHRPIEVYEDGPEAACQPISGSGEMNATIAALEERDAQISFKSLDLLGHRTMGDVEFTSSPDDAPMTSGGSPLKVSKLLAMRAVSSFPVPRHGAGLPDA